MIIKRLCISWHRKKYLFDDITVLLRKIHSLIFIIIILRKIFQTFSSDFQIFSILNGVINYHEKVTQVFFISDVQRMEFDQTVIVQHFAQGFCQTGEFLTVAPHHGFGGQFSGVRMEKSIQL